MTCRLCGYEYEGNESTCDACPLGGSGYLSCCPHCGYQNIGESKLIGFLERIWSRIRAFESRYRDR